MKIRELKECSPSQFEELRELMSELTERVVLTPDALEHVLRDESSHLYVIHESPCPSSSSTKLRTAEGEGRIIGCATLCVFHSPTGAKASIEDVVVSSAYRGRHFGRQLVEHLIEQARALSPIELMLTSNSKRIAANQLYQSLGFQRKETNCYRLKV